MFKEAFKATVSEVNFKRLSEERGGDLIVKITIGCFLTDPMIKDLGYDEGPNILSELQFKSITMDEVLEGVILEVWHKEQDPVDSPYLLIDGLTTKKYKLVRDEESHTIVFTIDLKTPALSEANIVRLLHCFDRDVTVGLQLAQKSLDLDPATPTTEQVDGE